MCVIPTPQYKKEIFWWELVEMLRKCILAGALVLFASGGVSQLLLGIVISVARAPQSPLAAPRIPRSNFAV